MQSASPQMQALLTANTRIPSVEVIVQFPNPANVLQLGGYLMLDGILEIEIQNNEEQSSDTFKLTLANNDGRYSPLQGTPLST
jgi:hypothetical protein